MSSIREKWEAIQKARDPKVIWSIKHFKEKYGQHPGGPIEDAKEKFFEALVAEIERLEKMVNDIGGRRIV